MKGSAPRIETQMTYLRPNRSPSGPPRSVPTATGAEEDEQMQLRALHREVESVDQVERVVVRDARQIDVLREDQRSSTASVVATCLAARAPARSRAALRRVDARQAVRLVPDAHVPQDRDRRDGQHATTRRRLAGPSASRRRPPRAGRAPSRDCPPSWNSDLREAVPAARRHARDARRLRMERRTSPMPTAWRRPRSSADSCAPSTARHSPVKREAHADREREGRRPPVGGEADDRLQQRRGDLVRERHEADLREGQPERRLERRDRSPARATGSGRLAVWQKLIAKST